MENTPLDFCLETTLHDHLEGFEFPSPHEWAVMADWCKINSDIRTQSITRREWNAKQGNYIESEPYATRFGGKTLYMPKTIRIGEVPAIIEHIERLGGDERNYANVNGMLAIKQDIVLAIEYLQKQLATRDQTLSHQDVARYKKAIQKYVRLFGRYFEGEDPRTSVIENANNKPQNTYAGSLEKRMETLRKYEAEDRIDDLAIVGAIVADSIDDELSLAVFERGIHLLRRLMENTDTTNTSTTQRDIDAYITNAETNLEKKIQVSSCRQALYAAKQHGDIQTLVAVEQRCIRAVQEAIFTYEWANPKEPHHGGAPMYILESKQLSCLGKAILTHAFLDRLGIPNACAMPGQDHVAITATLSDGSVWNIDPTNTPTPTQEPINTIQPLRQVDARRGLASALLNARACTHIQQKHYTEAFHTLKEAVDLLGENDAAWVNIGHIALYHKEVSVAEKAFKRAIDENPHNSGAWLGLGNIYEQQGNITQAIQYYGKAIAENPNERTAFERLGSILLATNGSLNVAIRCMEEVVRIAPQDTTAWNRLGACLERAKRFEDAKKCRTRAHQALQKHLETQAKTDNPVLDAFI